MCKLVWILILQWFYCWKLFSLLITLHTCSGSFLHHASVYTPNVILHVQNGYIARPKRPYCTSKTTILHVQNSHISLQNGHISRPKRPYCTSKTAILHVQNGRRRRQVLLCIICNSHLRSFISGLGTPHIHGPRSWPLFLSTLQRYVSDSNDPKLPTKHYINIRSDSDWPIYPTYLLHSKTSPLTTNL